MKKVIVYTTDYCPYCKSAKDLLARKKISFQEINLTHDAEKRKQLEDQTGWMTVPMIFIGDEFIGGSDDLHALENSGKLDKKLE